MQLVADGKPETPILSATKEAEVETTGIAKPSASSPPTLSTPPPLLQRSSQLYAEASASQEQHQEIHKEIREQQQKQPNQRQQREQHQNQQQQTQQKEQHQQLPFRIKQEIETARYLSENKVIAAEVVPPASIKTPAASAAISGPPSAVTVAAADPEELKIAKRNALQMKNKYSTLSKKVKEKENDLVTKEAELAKKEERIHRLAENLRRQRVQLRRQEVSKSRKEVDEMKKAVEKLLVKISPQKVSPPRSSTISNVETEMSPKASTRLYKSQYRNSGERIANYKQRQSLKEETESLRRQQKLLKLKRAQKEKEAAELSMSPSFDILGATPAGAAAAPSPIDVLNRSNERLQQQIQMQIEANNYKSNDMAQYQKQFIASPRRQKAELR